MQFIAPKGLAAFGSIDILHKKCFHHFVMETFWRYELQNAETQTVLAIDVSMGNPYNREQNEKERGDTMVELDQFKTTLNAYKEPLVEVRDSL